MKLSVVVVVALTVVLLGCGGEESSVAETVAAATKPAVEPAEVEIDPCEIIDEEMVRAHFEIGDAELSSRLSTSTHHPLCRVTWRKPDADEIEKETQAKMQEYMMAKTRGEDVKMPSFQTDNEVNLTINMPVSETSEAAGRSFESAMQMLERGIKDKDKPDAPPMFQYETERVEAVGENASWTPKLSQLSVQSGRYVFHVGVRLGDPETNREKAKAVAADIIVKLGE